MGQPTLGRSKKVFDPTPVKHITDECVFCKTRIPGEVLERPGIIHDDCHRPTCPDCIKDLKQTGLWGCWYCKTVDIDERNPQIQKELEKIREEKLKARRQPVERHRVEPIVSVSSSSTPIWPDNKAWHRMTAVANTEEYPHRDPPNPLDQEGWGAEPIFDMNDEDGVKPGTLIQESVVEMGKVEKWNSKQADILGVVGSKTMINKVTASMKDLKRIADLVMAGEEIDHKAFKRDETYGQIYTRIDWNAADTIAGYTLNEDARSHIVAEILKSLQQYYKTDLFKLGVITKNEMREGLMKGEQLKEEAQHGTGRTVQRIKSVFGHFVDGPMGLRKDFDTRRVLYLADSVREAKRINASMTQEWDYGFYRKLGRDTLATIKERTDIMSVHRAIDFATKGKEYSLIIADITYNTMVEKGETINKMLLFMGAPVIGDVITG